MQVLQHQQTFLFICKSINKQFTFYFSDVQGRIQSLNDSSIKLRKANHLKDRLKNQHGAPGNLMHFYDPMYRRFPLLNFPSFPAY